MNTLGIDIGGANLKAANSAGDVHTEPFALWKQPDQLAAKLQQLTQRLGSCDRLAITMTAELCDCFTDRTQGVRHVLQAIRTIAHRRQSLVWSSSGRFLELDAAEHDPMGVASANWHALATWLARLYPVGLSLLVDIGSTTTDVLRLRQGKPDVTGFTDIDRLATGELLYTGCSRTSLMSLGPTIPFRGRERGVMAEHFATTHDVYLLTGQTTEDQTNRDTADGQPRSLRHAAARVLRMVGADLSLATLEEARQLAADFARRQRQLISAAIHRVLADQRPDQAILAGSGAFIEAEVLSSLFPGLHVERLHHRIGPFASTAACAYALVQLRDRMA